ncbi:GIY-YIG nuclease family protein [Aeromonas veronii]|uniref:GIY-YIG nuclease family protein n=1 Tax=Aeromonas veronii TaxID=654 RepID=UPI003B9E6C15
MNNELITKLEEIRKKQLLEIHLVNEAVSISSSPPTRTAGFYWIYTSYSMEELKQAKPGSNNSSIDISKLAKLHCGLKNIHNELQDDFSVVYNGIASKSTGLKERLHQHINGYEGTGSLSILKSSLDDLTKWRISYVIIDDNGKNSYDDCIEINYDNDAHDLERMWRLHYGWPLLCQK